MNAQPPAYRTTNALAIVSLIFGICAWCVLPMLGAIVAIVCGHLARSEIRTSRGQQEGEGLATVGLVLGYVQLALAVFATVVVVFFLGLGFGLLHWH